MKRLIIFLILNTFIYGKELVYTSFLETSSSIDIVEGYNKWQNQVLDLRLNEDLRELQFLKSKGGIQKEQLKFLYRDAEYRIITERESLKNDLIRAKIYYYYHKHHRKYYYYDFNYNIIYLN